MADHASDSDQHEDAREKVPEYATADDPWVGRTQCCQLAFFQSDVDEKTVVLTAKGSNKYHCPKSDRGGADCTANKNMNDEIDNWVHCTLCMYQYAPSDTVRRPKLLRDGKCCSSRQSLCWALCSSRQSRTLRDPAGQSEREQKVKRTLEDARSSEKREIIDEAPAKRLCTADAGDSLEEEPVDEARAHRLAMFQANAKSAIENPYSAIPMAHRAAVSDEAAVNQVWSDDGGAHGGGDGGAEFGGDGSMAEGEDLLENCQLEFPFAEVVAPEPAASQAAPLEAVVPVAAESNSEAAGPGGQEAEASEPIALEPVQPAAADS
jgi:hypothetical protein